jgi:hypothetical protein
MGRCSFKRICAVLTEQDVDNLGARHDRGLGRPHT